MLKNQKGFTLLEIIAVLVILGILAAVATPKYFSLIEEAQKNAAESAIGEVKARANLYYALKTLRDKNAPSAAAIFASVTAAPNVGPDFGVTAAADGTGDITITVNSVKGAAITAVTGIWTYPVAD